MECTKQGRRGRMAGGVRRHSRLSSRSHPDRPVGWQENRSQEGWPGASPGRPECMWYTRRRLATLWKQR